jgi:hypothetical protein
MRSSWIRIINKSWEGETPPFFMTFEKLQSSAQSYLELRDSIYTECMNAWIERGRSIDWAKNRLEHKYSINSAYLSIDQLPLIHNFLESNYSDRYDYDEEGVIVYMGDASIYVPHLNDNWDMYEFYIKISFNCNRAVMRTKLRPSEIAKRFYHPHSDYEDESELWDWSLCMGDDARGNTIRFDKTTFVWYMIDILNHFQTWVNSYNPEDSYKSLPINEQRYNDYDLLLSHWIDEIDFEITYTGVKIVEDNQWFDVLQTYFPEYFIAGPYIPLKSEVTRFLNQKFIFRDEEIKFEVASEHIEKTFNREWANSFKYRAERRLQELLYTFTP